MIVHFHGGVRVAHLVCDASHFQRDHDGEVFREMVTVGEQANGSARPGEMDATYTSG